MASQLTMLFSWLLSGVGFHEQKRRILTVYGQYAVALAPFDDTDCTCFESS